jgi:hypothetical protein
MYLFALAVALIPVIQIIREDRNGYLLQPSEVM